MSVTKAHLNLMEGQMLSMAEEFDALRSQVLALREALGDAETGLSSALGMVERSGWIPDWDQLTEARQRARAALEISGVVK